jgi:long-chain-fatty-acid--[acyl-carrier-protein] ligase
MRNLIIKLLFFIFKVLFSLRYKITIKGLNQLTKKSLNKKCGILFLPNHPAHLDPIINALILWPIFKIRPLVVEYVYRQSGINSVMKLIKALSVPNLESSINELKIRKARDVVEKIIVGLKKHENFMLYPAGRLKHTGKEIIGGASATHHIIEKCPEVNIVLIRTSGLWGSSFSRAILGKSPDFKTTFINGLKALLKGGIFFLPKRKVVIEFTPAPLDFPRYGSRIEINKYLENWYNRYPSKDGIAKTEPINLVSYSPWKTKLLTPHEIKEKRKPIKDIEISQTTKDKVILEIAKIANRSANEITPEKELAVDLGLDSLDVAELISFLGVNFDVGEIHADDLVSVFDALEIAEGHRKISTSKEEKPTNIWPDEKPRPPVMPPIGKSLQEAFLRSCDRMKNHIACGDDVTGIMNYYELKRAALILSKEIKKSYRSKHIGVMLPASLGAYIVILGILLADKIPVMLNWTLGPRYLNNMMGLTNVKSVITSWRFLERLSNVEFGHLVNHLVFLEDIKKRISKKDKILGALFAKRSANAILNKLNLTDINKDDPAVILFTSGTEASPKGVPLSHENILFNQRAALQCVDLTSKDTMYGVLPPFHSFGFNVAGLFPILTGMKIAFFPDPTDSFRLAEGIDRWKISMFCSAPSFMKGLFLTAKPGQLDSVRLFVSGAEKAPPMLFKKVSQLKNKAKLIEGYGITECSPIISINKVNIPSRGVGQILPGIDACIIHPETHELMDSKREGEICVHSPSVFHGYLGNQKSPFIKINNKNFYKTGDLGTIDDNNNIILSGRLKRFTKIAGEMISLGAIEDILAHSIFIDDNEDEEHHLAVCANELEDEKTQLILFSTIELNKDDINHILKNAGMSRLVKISQIKKIDEIPLLGTGKTDYRYLQSMLD